MAAIISPTYSKITTMSKRPRESTGEEGNGRREGEGEGTRVLGGLHGERLSGGLRVHANVLHVLIRSKMI